MDLDRLSLTGVLPFAGVVGVLIFLALERFYPFRKARLSRWQRWLINFSLSFCNILLVDQLFVRILIPADIFAHPSRWTLFDQFHLNNSLLRVATAIVALDLVMYFWHRLNHGIPLLWRFHRVHHTDLEVDVSSGVRFHFGEVTVGTMITYSLMLTLGATILETRLAQAVLIVMTEFGHSNIKLWRRFENFFWCFFVTPSMHRVHHSNFKAETDSNYGTIFSFWDRLFGTINRTANADGLVFGLTEFKDPTELTLPKLLSLPFRGWLRFTLILGGRKNA